MSNKTENFNPILYLVHCVDTEGPLHESLEETFERLKSLFGIELKASKQNLIRLQNQEIDFGYLTKDIAKTFSPHLIQYNDSWDKIDQMLDKIMKKQYRNKFKDSFGNGIIYNWHCVDHVGFETNIRRKDFGFGHIFKHYKRKIAEHSFIDPIHWHFHPISFDKESHINATSYDNCYPLLHQVISRKLIDHNYFPIVNRAGYHVIRQDSSFFLEQWIPFDYSNQSTYENNYLQNDIHRYGDWRRASKKWFPYHPSHDDYQISGNMNRLTTKCLNIGTRYKLLTDKEIEFAFKDAIENGSAILAFTNHDFRDMAVDVEDVYKRIKKIHNNFENVTTVNSDAISAMRNTHYGNEANNKKEIEINIKIIDEDYFDKIIVNVLKGKVFGSQPYLAIKTKEGKYHHDNLNERKHLKSWEYILDKSSIELSKIEKIAVACNDAYGNQSIASLNVKELFK